MTLGGALVAPIVVYMLAAKAMGIEELDDVLALVRRRRRRRDGGFRARDPAKMR